MKKIDFFIFDIINPSLDQPRDLLLPFVATLAFAVAHYLVLELFLKPIGRWLLPVQIVEKAPVDTDSSHNKQTSASLKNRKKQTKNIEEIPEKQLFDSNKAVRTKFIVSAWRFMQYSASVSIGIYVLSSLDFTTKPDQWFKNWPDQGMSQLEKIYYHVGFGSYAYAIIDLFVQPKLKDFIPMFIHHVTTLFLIYSSYIWGFHRIGCVILLLHDVSDPFMEIAKACLYAKLQLLADVFVTIFALTFLYTRIYLYPVFVISSIPLYCWFEDGSIMPNFWVNRSSFGALCILQMLHIYWAYLILLVVYKAVTSSGVQGDVRDPEE